jgi:hypothetical protein
LGIRLRGFLSRYPFYEPGCEGLLHASMLRDEFIVSKAN